MKDEDEIYEVEEAAPPPGPGERARIVASTVLGAALCIVIVVGAGWWLTDVGGREAASLPVFRAALDPAKVRPDEPGGAETPYRNIRSYEVAVGEVTAGSAEARLAPPPDEPTEEDVAMGVMANAGSGLIPASDISGTDVPAGDTEPDAADAPETAGQTPEEPVEEPEPGEAEMAEAPPARPSDVVATSDGASQQAIDEAAQLAVSAALSPVQIQLGAFTDRDYTEDEWRRIARANPDVLGGRALAIQSTVSGGNKFYRLRVGPFRSRDEAARVCEALKARGQDCLVATNG